jgi:hypothetical protein
MKSLHSLSMITEFSRLAPKRSEHRKGGEI